jgi:hypothetical protein
MEFHLFGATQDRQLWHTLANLKDSPPFDFTSEPWGDVDVQALGHPGTGKVLDSACTMDGQGNLHVLVVTDEGNEPNKLWIAIRSKKTRDWMKFADVETGSGGQAGPGPSEDIVAVTATTRMTPPEDLHLHIFALTNKGNLFHAVWARATGGDNPWEKGPNGQPAKWVKKFTQIKIDGRPGTFTTLETTSLR